MILTIVQARMGSTRFPGKSMADLAGEPMVRRVCRRAADITGDIGGTILAVPNTEDKPFWPWKPVCYGDPTDLLARFWACAQVHRHRGRSLSHIIRITGDCPLLDVGVARAVVETALQGSWDIVHTTPALDGLDVEVFTVSALARAHRGATTPEDREHVTPWMRKNLSVKEFGLPELGQIHWSVDEPKDLEFVRAVYAACDHCLAGVPHHTNSATSIGGNGHRRFILDLHHLERGDLVECQAADLLRSKS